MRFGDRSQWRSRSIGVTSCVRLGWFLVTSESKLTLRISYHIIIGVNLAGLLGGDAWRVRRWVRAEWGGIWGGVSPVQPTKGSGGASWAPPAGSGAEPRPKTDFDVFWRPQNAHFCTYMTKSGGGTISISVPPFQILRGLVPLSPPVIYAHAYHTSYINGFMIVSNTGVSYRVRFVRLTFNGHFQCR